MMQDLAGKPRTAAAIAGNRRVKSLPFLLLCGAPHNSNYAERAIMWSAPPLDLRPALFSTV
jgi:hypothetical protein